MSDMDKNRLAVVVHAWCGGRCDYPHCQCSAVPTNATRALAALDKHDAETAREGVTEEATEGMQKELGILKTENAALRQHIADINNRHRHVFSTAVEAASDALFKACAWPHVMMRELAAGPKPETPDPATVPQSNARADLITAADRIARWWDFGSDAPDPRIVTLCEKLAAWLREGRS